LDAVNDMVITVPTSQVGQATREAEQRPECEPRLSIEERRRFDVWANSAETDEAGSRTTTDEAEALSPMDILAEEMGAVAGRVERELTQRVKLAISEMRERELQHALDQHNELDSLRRELAELRVAVAELKGILNK
jgi:hypothetical protein